MNSCHDNCGKISDGVDCSCDWLCYKKKNCCPDIQIKCPYSEYFISLVNGIVIIIYLLFIVYVPI